MNHKLGSGEVLTSDVSDYTTEFVKRKIAEIHRGFADPNVEVNLKSIYTDIKLILDVIDETVHLESMMGSLSKKLEIKD